LFALVSYEHRECDDSDGGGGGGDDDDDNGDAEEDGDEDDEEDVAPVAISTVRASPGSSTKYESEAKKGNTRLS